MVAEVAFQGGSVADVLAVGVFEIGQFADKCLFEFLFGHDYRLSGGRTFFWYLLKASD